MRFFLMPPSVKKFEERKRPHRVGLLKVSRAVHGEVLLYVLPPRSQQNPKRMEFKSFAYGKCTSRCTLCKPKHITEESRSNCTTFLIVDEEQEVLAEEPFYVNSDVNGRHKWKEEDRSMHI